MNIILQTDSYKASHWKQYPPKTNFVHSYFESRGGEYPKVLFFGLQYFLKRYLIGPIVTQVKIDEAKKFYSEHFGRTDVFNEDGWTYILKKHGGYLPVAIHAVPEGSIVPVSTPLFTVENTDPKCFWLTSYLETLLEQVWYPTTVATRSHHIKTILEGFLKKTGDENSLFKLHDFGYRGSTSQESAGLGGAAHLISFLGSDNLAGIKLLQDFYDAGMCGYSIPAMEHSTVTAWGRDKEMQAYQNMLRQFPGGIIAAVSDSYNIFNVAENFWGNALKDEVKKHGGTVVVRPDSGDPVDVVLELLKILGRTWKWKKNDKGYYVLPKEIRVIQGDGVDERTIFVILNALRLNKISTDNIAFGSGGGLLQKMNRDTLQFAYKCSNITVGKTDHDVFKDPITSHNKSSKKGRQNQGMDIIFTDGWLQRDWSLLDIKKRAGVL